MTAVITDTIEKVTEWVTQDGDHEKACHIVVPASAVLEATVSGNPCRALCGKLWTPTRDPEQFPVCQGCIDAYESGTGKPWTGRR